MTQPEALAKIPTIETRLRRLAEEENRPTGLVVIYASFGVVKGRLAAFSSGADSETAGEGPSVGVAEGGEPVGQCHSGSVVEISDATVEHYHSHLPTASFGRLFIRAGDIHGFALGSSQSQG